MNELNSYLELDLDHPDAERMMKLATQTNPAVKKALDMGFSTLKIPPEIKAYQINYLYNSVYLPRFFYTLLEAKNGVHNIRDVRVQNKLEPFGKPIKMRDYQIPAINQLLERLQESETLNSGVLQALMGSGKTTVLLETIRRMRQKTAVLVHTEFLLHQWVERTQEFLGFTPGIVQGDKADFSQPITVFLIQSLLRRDYEDLDQFGLVAFDEFHRYSADWFSQAITKFPAKYRLACSGTMERTDGMEWIGHSHLGPVNVTMERSDNYKVEPLVYQMSVPENGVKSSDYMVRGKPSHPKIISALSKSESRNRWLVTNLRDAAKGGRKIIVFSDRREHLEHLAYSLELHSDFVPSYTFLIGGVKEKERLGAETKQIVFCTWGYAAEGVDLPHLDAAFIATPRSHVQQAVGRIERMVEGKKQPIVFDPVDYNISVCVGMANKRMKYYQSRGWIQNA